MPERRELIAGDALKAAALQYSGDMRARIHNEQGGLLSIFDGWFTRVVARLLQFDPARFWEDSVRDYAAQSPQARELQWDLMRLRQFLDRRQHGRFVEFSERERSAGFYQPRFGTEFGVDVQLTCQGAPSLIRWRGTAMMKNVFDFAMYPALIGELRPRTVFEIGSGLGASAAWFADTMTFCGSAGHVHSVDVKKARLEHPQVSFYQGDCANPQRLFDPALLRSAPHPWLVVEDAHHNVAGVLAHMHEFLASGDYLVVEDTDVKRDAVRAFIGAHPGDYLVDTKFTDNFGRNATCAADAIFVRTPVPADRT
jgi:cephalosporin hydroxylase